MPADLVQSAAKLRADQQMEAALDTITRAAKQVPNDPRAALGLAQISFETWRPAAALFAAAQQVMPANPDLIRNHALALAAEGDLDQAVALLDSVLAANPAWLDGHRTLAVLRITNGGGDEFDARYAAACRDQPGNVALRMAWFQHHAIARDWDKAGRILADAQAEIGPNQSLEMAAIFLASESGQLGDDDQVFDVYSTLRDPGLDLCHVRHSLRTGRVERAEEIALRQIDTSAARMFWPYLALCWRLNGDARAQWLDGGPDTMRTFDLDMSQADLAALASVLRGLHRMKMPYPEQSVRGGTQTDRQLFFHPDPTIQNARAKIIAAISDYLADLPPPDAKHPLLSHRRDVIRFEGSWSVRLSDAGFHSCHTHPMGWISSAFYVALPAPDHLGPKPAGWLELGRPPPELGLDLEPVAQIEPMPGRLVLFPSTAWHGTCPFGQGERLTMAFDVSVPAR